MKKFNLLILFLMSFVFVNAQTILITEQNYQNLKASCNLLPNVNYKFIDSPSNLNTTKNHQQTQPKFSVSNARTTTGTCQCMVPVDPTFSVVPITSGTAPDYRNDDGSTAAIPLGFNFCFYGTTYTSCYINNNGNISFGSPYSTFSSNPFPDPGFVMIAPFWGDVDTRDLGSGLPYFKKTATSLIVKWSNVGYYSNMSDKLNDFQLIITDGTDPMLPNGNNVAFCYGDMQWTTGSASQGVNGFGGIPSTVGVNKGDGTNFIQIARFDKPGVAYDGPYGQNDGISFLDNKSYFFNTCGTNNNLPPIVQDATGGGSACGDTIKICALGDTMVYTTTFLAPENNQTISITGSAPTLGGSFVPLGVTTTTGGITTYAWMVVASASVTGVHTIVVTGTDNGNPPLSTSATYYIKIKNLVVPQPTIVASPSGTICATPGATLSVSNCSAFDNVYWSTGSGGCSTIASASGLYYVTVEKLGCYKSFSESVFVFPNPLVTMPVSPIVFCNGSSAVLTPTVTVGAPNYTYAWTPASLGTASTATTAAAGTFTVMVTDQHSCKGTATVSVVKSTPSVSLSSPDYTICPGECSQITALGASSFPPFTYSWSNSPIYVRDSTFACVAGTVSVIFTDNKGCSATKTATVVNDVIPVASFIANSTPPFTPGQPINFISTSTIPSGTITSYVWLFGDGNGANGNPVNHAYVNSGTYPVTLVVTGSNGCLDTVVVNYMVDAIIELPNVFTPNGDNVNDHLKFRNLEAFSKNTLTIFNRWGKKVFQQDNYKNDWNGSGVSDGTYFFILEIPDATPSSYKGYIELMR